MKFPRIVHPSRPRIRFRKSIGLYVTRYIIDIEASYAVDVITAATDAVFGFYIFQIAT